MKLLALSCLLAACASPSADPSPDGGASDAPPDQTLAVQRQWFPGHYLLVNTAESGNGEDTADAIDELLSDPAAAPFTGVHFKLAWRSIETAYDTYDFRVLDAALAAVASHTCRDAEGHSAPCRATIQFQYKTANYTLPLVPNYLLSTGSFCSTPGYACELPSDPAQRTAEQDSWCTADNAWCGVYVFIPDNSGGGEVLPLVWLPGVHTRVRKVLTALGHHIATGPYADTVASFALPETNFEIDVANATQVLDSLDYTHEAYEDALHALETTLLDAAPRQVVYQFVGNMPPYARTDLAGWEAMVRRFYAFALAHPGLGIGHADTAPLLGPTAGNPEFTINPVIEVMRDPTLQGRVPRNPNIQAPDILAPDRSNGFPGVADGGAPYDSYTLPVDAAQGNQITWTTSTRATSGHTVVFTWKDVSSYIATHPLPAANRARPTY